MDKENNIVYVQTKNGIFKCYKSEQMHKPIYYPIESKTNGYIDYNDVIRILNIDDLYEQVKKQKEIINKKNNYIAKYDIFKVFSFPLMKRWEEEQVKSSIDYEFKTSLIKDLKDILNEGKNE